MDVKSSDTTYITIHPDPVSEINISVIMTLQIVLHLL